jgi:hypothetical protein
VSVVATCTSGRRRQTTGIKVVIYASDTSVANDITVLTLGIDLPIGELLEIRTIVPHALTVHVHALHTLVPLALGVAVGGGEGYWW